MVGFRPEAVDGLGRVNDCYVALGAVPEELASFDDFSTAIVQAFVYCLGGKPLGLYGKKATVA